MKNKIKALAVSVALAATVTACGHDNFRDVKGVPNRHPDSIINYENMDGHPNIGLLCIKGVPVFTTTRGYSALTIVPETNGTEYLYNYCKGSEK